MKCILYDGDQYRRAALYNRLCIRAEEMKHSDRIAAVWALIHNHDTEVSWEDLKEEEEVAIKLEPREDEEELPFLFDEEDPSYSITTTSSKLPTHSKSNNLPLKTASDDFDNLFTTVEEQSWTPSSTSSNPIPIPISNRFANQLAEKGDEINTFAHQQDSKLKNIEIKEELLHGHTGCWGFFNNCSC
jgi:hypothetical protein